MNNNINITDIIVIGAGAAGMTAALYSLRAGKKVTLFECEGIGGQIATSPRVENFPTIKEISGEELSNRLFTQIDDLGVNFEFANVDRIEKTTYNNKEVFKVTYDNTNIIYSYSVIIATGAKHRKIGIDKEDELVGNGVSYCAVCDGAFYKGEDVCLIGDANSALQYANLLSNYCNKVYLYTLFDRFFGEKSLIDLVLSKENIIVEHNLSLKEFLTKDDKLSGLVFENTQTHELKTLNVPGCFIAIGQVPHNENYTNLVKLNKQGYIITNDDLETETKGIFAAGDCREKKIRQLTTAVNDGTIASINACNYIDKLLK